MALGQINTIGIMIAVVVIVLALAIAPTMVEFSAGARNETDLVGGTGLNCTSTALSDYDKGACGIVDLYPVWFIGVLIGLAAIYFIAKIIVEVMA